MNTSTSTTGTTVSTPVIVPIDTPTLGDRSYLAHDGQVAVIVDPQRDIDRVLGLAADAGVRISDVFETHIHNDYVTGGLALAQATGARYHVNGADEVAYDRSPISDGDVVEVSASMRVRAISTPGHTYTHLSYALEASTDDSGEFEPVGVFTGGSLLFGATGRPDLLGHDHTHDLVHHQFASAASPTSCPSTRTCCRPTASGRSARLGRRVTRPRRPSGRRSDRTRP